MTVTTTTQVMTLAVGLFCEIKGSQMRLNAPRAVQRRWCVTLCVALAALHAGTAQASVVSPGLVGGGALLLGSEGGSGDMLIGLRVTPDDRVRINASVQISCPGGDGSYTDTRVAAVAVVAPDGTFRAVGSRAQRFGSTQTQTAYAIAGTFTATGATGTATVSVADNDPVFPTCDSASIASGTVGWQARRSTAVGAPGAAAGAVLYGTTSQRVRGTAGAFVMRVSPDGKRLDRVMFHVRERCTRRVLDPNFTLRTDDDYLSLSLRTPIRQNGTFVAQSRLRRTDEGVILRLSNRLAGKIGTLGARGTYRSDRRLITARTRRIRERCATTPSIRWKAAA